MTKKTAEKHKKRAYIGSALCTHDGDRCGRAMWFGK